MIPHQHNSMLDQKQDSRPTDALIALALAEKDTERRWDLVVTLHMRPTREVLDAAVRLCEGRSARERILGADTLGQLGVYDKWFLVVEGESVYDSTSGEDKV